MRSDCESFQAMFENSEFFVVGGYQALHEQAAELREHLKAFIDSNDMLLVVALTGEAAWTGVMVSNDPFKQSIAA